MLNLFKRKHKIVMRVKLKNCNYKYDKLIKKWLELIREIEKEYSAECTLLLEDE